MCKFNNCNYKILTLDGYCSIHSHLTQTDFKIITNHINYLLDQISRSLRSLNKIQFCIEMFEYFTTHHLYINHNSILKNTIITNIPQLRSSLCDLKHTDDVTKLINFFDEFESKYT